MVETPSRLYFKYSSWTALTRCRHVRFRLNWVAVFLSIFAAAGCFLWPRANIARSNQKQRGRPRMCGRPLCLRASWVNLHFQNNGQTARTYKKLTTQNFFNIVHSPPFHLVQFLETGLNVPPFDKAVWAGRVLLGCPFHNMVWMCRKGKSRNTIKRVPACMVLARK